MLFRSNGFLINEEGSGIELEVGTSGGGGDAVKFQCYDTNSFLSSEIDNSRIKKLNKFALNFNQFKKLSIYAKKKNDNVVEVANKYIYMGKLNEMIPFNVKRNDELSNKTTNQNMTFSMFKKLGF